MAVNLIEQAKSLLTSEVLNQVAGQLGESSDRTEKAVEAGIPALLAGLLKMATTPSGASNLFDMLKHESHEVAHLGGLDGLPGNLGELLGGGSLSVLVKYGQNVLNSLFGGNLNSMLELISKVSGIKTSSASSLLGMLAPLLLGMLRKDTVSRGMGPAGLTELLMSQKDTIARYAPAGLASVLGLKNLTDLGSAADTLKFAGTNVARDVQRQTAAAAAQGSSALRWAAPLILLAGLLLGAMYWMNNSGTAPTQPNSGPMAGEPANPGRAIPDQVSRTARETGQAVTTAGKGLVETALRMVPLSLPGNIKLEVPENSALEKIATFSTSPASAQTPKSFVADHLSVEGILPKISPDSAATISGLGTILKAFGTAKLRIEGYTDNVGDPIAQKSESLERATAVKDSLVAVGVPADRITVEGVGPDRPIAPNDTAEGRGKNRRIEFSIVPK